MSTFTMRLSEILDSGETIWHTDDKYPIFDEAFREPLQQKIERHYLNWEIGQETVQMFRFALNRKMHEIMPYYNQLYLSEINIDPLQTVDVTNTGETSGTESANTTTANDTDSTTDSKSRAVASETPQTRLQGDEDYATNASDSVSNATAGTHVEGTGTQESTTAGNVLSTMKGSQGHAAALLMQYRKSLLNIDMNVIQELESLFMMVWDNGDTFSDTEGPSRNVYPFAYYPYL